MAADLRVSSPWRPLPVDQLIERLRGAEFFWCLAGGVAIARLLGRSYRPHRDTDIVILRSQQVAVQKWFSTWRLFAADPPGRLRPWVPNEILPQDVHDVWCHRDGNRTWELQMMILESDGDTWLYRRDPRINGSVSELARMVGGIPSLRMDLQLLFKSKTPRPKDETDFRELLPILTDEERETLAYWLRLTNPGGHPWLDDLV